MPVPCVALAWLVVVVKSRTCLYGLPCSPESNTGLYESRFALNRRVEWVGAEKIVIACNYDLETRSEHWRCRAPSRFALLLASG